MANIKRKKYYRISRENGQIEFSDKYDEALGYIGLTEELTFSRRITDKDMLKMSRGLRRPGPLLGSTVEVDGEPIPNNFASFAAALDATGKMKGRVHAILPGESVMIEGDGLMLFSGTHPRPPFWKGLWERVKAIFIRPKFSAAALEPYEPTEEEREYRTRVLGHFEEAMEARKCVRCGLEKEEQHQCKFTMTLLETMRKEAVSQFPRKGHRLGSGCNCWVCHPTRSKYDK